MQTNYHSHCSYWFDYDTPCTDATCDEVPWGDRTRLPLSTKGKQYAATPAKLCAIKAPFQGWEYDVKTVCKQICDYCAPTTPSTTTSTTTTDDNRRKYDDSKIFETFYWVSFMCFY